MKIVINRCFGGFGLSSEALKRLGRKYDHDIPRNDPDLVACVEEIGSAADGGFAELSVVEIPDDVDFGIYEYDGLEHVYDKKRVWGLDADDA